MPRTRTQKSHSEQAPIASAQMLTAHLCGSCDASFRDSLASSTQLFYSSKHSSRAGCHLHLVTAICPLALPFCGRTEIAFGCPRDSQLRVTATKIQFCARACRSHSHEYKNPLASILTVRAGGKLRIHIPKARPFPEHSEVELPVHGGHLC